MVDFIEKARANGKNEGHLYIIGCIISFLGGQFLGSIPLILLMIKSGNLSTEVMTNPSLLGISNNTFLVLALFPFIISFLVLWFFIRFVHKKQFLTSFTAFSKFNLKRFFISFILWLFMSGILDIANFLTDPTNYEFNFKSSAFIPLLLISILIIPIQTSFEELLFRSYLLQGIGLWKPYRIIPFLITSVSFGLMHIMNPEIGEYGYIVLFQYLGTGFLLGALTMLSDGLELSLGMHAANNIYGALVVSFKGSALHTDSLFYCKEMKVDWISTSASLCIMAFFLILLKYIFKLKPYSYLWSKVAPQTIKE